MSEFTQTLLISNLYRVLCLATGFGIAYFGFRLFRVGITAQPSGAEGNIGAFKFAFKNLAPGSFFAVCGVLIAFAGAMRPVTVTRGTDNSISLTYPPAGQPTMALVSVAASQSKPGQGATPSSIALSSFDIDALLKKLKDGASLTDTDRAQIESLIASSEHLSSSSLFSGSQPPCEIKSVTMGYTTNQTQPKWYELWK